MKIEKAIEVLEDILRQVKPGDPPDEHDAVKLGVEALKYHLLRRKTVDAVGSPLLPGETKD